MGSNRKRCKSDRTTQEQLEFFMQFCRKHSEILGRGDRCPPTLRDSQHLWEEIAKNLNSMRGPIRSSAKWRDSLLHWKSQFRSRIKKMLAHRKDTRAVTSFEKQTLQTLEAVAVDNIPLLSSLESQETLTISHPIDIPEIKCEVEVTEEEPMSPFSVQSPSTFAPLNVDCSLSPATSVSFASGPTTKTKEVTLEDILEALTENTKSREEREERAIAQQAQMTIAFQQLSESFMAMTEVLKKLSDKQDNLK